MASSNEGLIRSYVKMFTGMPVAEIQTQIATLDGEARKAALDAVQRVPKLASELLKGLAWVAEPREFVIILELIPMLEHDEQRTALTFAVAQLQKESLFRRSTPVRQAIESLWNNEQVPVDVRQHDLLKKFL